MTVFTWNMPDTENQTPHYLTSVWNLSKPIPHKYEVEPGGCSLGLHSSIETQLQLSVRGGFSVDAVGRQVLESCVSRKGDWSVAQLYNICPASGAQGSILVPVPSLKAIRIRKNS